MSKLHCMCTEECFRMRSFKKHELPNKWFFFGFSAKIIPWSLKNGGRFFQTVFYTPRTTFCAGEDAERYNIHFLDFGPNGRSCVVKIAICLSDKQFEKKTFGGKWRVHVFFWRRRNVFRFRVKNLEAGSQMEFYESRESSGKQFWEKIQLKKFIRFPRKKFPDSDNEVSVFDRFSKTAIYVPKKYFLGERIWKNIKN